MLMSSSNYVLLESTQTRHGFAIAGMFKIVGGQVLSPVGRFGHCPSYLSRNVQAAEIGHIMRNPSMLLLNRQCAPAYHSIVTEVWSVSPI